MSSVPEVRDVVYILNPLASEYFELGIQLGIEYDLLTNNIKGRKEYSQSRCLIETIHLWKNITDEFSWSALAKAVERIGGHDNIVNEIRAYDSTKVVEDSKSTRKRCATQNGSDDEQEAAKPHVKRLDMKTAATNLMQHTSSPNPEPLVEEKFLELLKEMRYLQRDTVQEVAKLQVKVERLDMKTAATNLVQHTSFPNPEPLVEEKFLELVKEMKYLQRDTVASDISVTSDVYCCGCDDRCTLDKLCTEVCPNLVKRKVHLVNVSFVQETTQNATPAVVKFDLFYHEEIAKDIQKLYGAFVTDTDCSFKNGKVNIDKLMLFLYKAFPTSMQSSRDKLNKHSCMEDVFGIIPSSWYKYEEIQGMIEYAGDDNDKYRLKIYKDCVKEYKKQKLPKRMKHIILGGRLAPKEGEQVIVEIDDKATFHKPDLINGTLLLPCWISSKESSTLKSSEGTAS